MRFDDGTFTLNQGSTLDGAFVLAGSTTTLSIPGVATLDGTLSWSSTSTMDGSGAGIFVIADGATVNATASDNDLFIDALTVNNSGTFNYQTVGPADLFPLGGAVFNNLPGGVFSIDTDRILRFGAVGSTFNNMGTVSKTGNPGITIVESGVVFNNLGGTMDLQSGTVELQTSTHSGDVFLTGGNALRLASGAHTIGPGVFDGEDLVISSGTVTMSGRQQIDTLNLSGGAIVNVNDTLEVTNLNWTGTSEIDGGGSGKLIIPFGGNVAVTAVDGDLFIDALTVHNSGTFNYNTSNVADFSPMGGAVFNNLSDGVFAIDSDRLIRPGSGGGTINNYGTVSKTGNSTNTVVEPGVVFNNIGGTMDMQSGTISLQGGGSVSGTFSSLGNAVRFDDGTFTLNQGSTLDGAFVLAGSTTTLSIPGVATLDGTLSWSSISTMDGSGTGTLVITDEATVNATASDGDLFIDALTVNNSGTFNYQTVGPADLFPLGGAVFNNLPGGVFSIDTDRII